MLNEQFLRFMATANGLKLAAYLSGLSEVSQKTLAKPLAKISDRTLTKGAEKSREIMRRQLEAADYTSDEAANWLEGHPGQTMPGAISSAVVYDAQIDGVMSFPLTMELACDVDRLSSQLFEARQKDDLNGFKSALLCSDFGERAYYLCTSEEGGGTAKPALLRQLELASEWSELDEVWPTIVANVTLSLLGHWDVEFCRQYFAKYEPRPIFALVLPRLDPALGPVDVGVLPRRRDMFWYPVRRLIDVMACWGKFVRTGRWPDAVPQPKGIIREAELKGLEWNDQTLTNWRDGTAKFVMDDFVELWGALCTMCDGRIASPPWPLFVAALMWQDLLTNVSTNSKDRTMYLVEDDYMPWWRSHYEELKAKGYTFGTTPWPDCFNKV